MRIKGKSRKQSCDWLCFRCMTSLFFASAVASIRSLGKLKEWVRSEGGDFLTLSSLRALHPASFESFPLCTHQDPHYLLTRCFQMAKHLGRSLESQRASSTKSFLCLHRFHRAWSASMACAYLACGLIAHLVSTHPIWCRRFGCASTRFSIQSMRSQSEQRHLIRLCSLVPRAWVGYA